MVKYPQCLFKPGARPMAGLLLEAITVLDDGEFAAAMAEGWFESPEAADAARPPPPVWAQEPAPADPAPLPPEDTAPLTRADLEAKAAELGIAVDGRWGDKRLAEAIAKKLAG